MDGAIHHPEKQGVLEPRLSKCNKRSLAFCRKVTKGTRTRFGRLIVFPGRWYSFEDNDYSFLQSLFRLDSKGDARKPPGEIDLRPIVGFALMFLRRCRRLR
ncbi:hypothetical protein CGZ80_10625 [Rhodopirellula sp. MGV]|nr:hypothetical protein CGZ80_10625 [Rhodopirellula sp. MGV]